MLRLPSARRATGGAQHGSGGGPWDIWREGWRWMSRVFGWARAFFGSADRPLSLHSRDVAALELGHGKHLARGGTLDMAERLCHLFRGRCGYHTEGARVRGMVKA
jgi:hypothetical protein